jgi:hypothetical protein
MKRPLVLTIVMWFAILYTGGAAVGIAAALLGFGHHYAVGGFPVTRVQWLRIAAPLIGIVAILMGASAIGLWRHRRWARSIFMCIWPVIAIYGLTSGFLHAVPWSLAWRAVIDATVVGLVAAFLFFRHRPSVLYFQQAR